MSNQFLKFSDKTVLCYARLGFAGKSPVAPGTCGSLLAIILAPFLFMPLPLWARAVFLIAVFWTGLKAGDKAVSLTGKEDPSEVVIDELLGQWLCCFFFATLGVLEYFAAFLLFRLFDIYKPWPVNYLEKFKGGLGIMLDDAMAGIYAAICLAVLRWVLA